MHKIFLLLVFAVSLLAFTNSSQPASLSHTIPADSTDSIYVNTRGHSIAVENLEDSLLQLYNQTGLKNYGLDFNVFRLGVIGYYNLRHADKLNSKKILTIIDFTKPSTAKRFYTIDLKNHKVIYHTYVAHGRNTGENMAKLFSNRPHSNQSSLGFYVTGETYVGSKGYSLKLDGQDRDFNSNIRKRAVVMHAADYVSESWIRKYGRLGRSQGCPALPKAISGKVINTIKNKTAIFAYYADKQYLESSAHLDVGKLLEQIQKTGKDQVAVAP